MRATRLLENILMRLKARQYNAFVFRKHAFHDRAPIGVRWFGFRVPVVHGVESAWGREASEDIH